VSAAEEYLFFVKGGSMDSMSLTEATARDVMETLTNFNFVREWDFVSLMDDTFVEIVMVPFDMKEINEWFCRMFGDIDGKGCREGILGNVHFKFHVVDMKRYETKDF
jgi:hypothetical protein